MTYRGEQVCSRLYVALRDPLWRTAKLITRRRVARRTSLGFMVEADAVSGGPMPAEVALRYTADGDGLTAEVVVTATAAFEYRRIGFCVLFPMQAYAGEHATAWRAGVAAPVRFPREVLTRADDDLAAVRFHRPFDRLDTRRMEWAFDGEPFEFEDQRNWTDPSYKAYSCPPERDQVMRAVAGQRFTQRIRVRARPAAPRFDRPEQAQVQLGGPVAAVPPIGMFDGRLSARSLRPAGGFHDLNASRPAAPESVELALNGAVHAADGESVMATTATHGLLMRQARELAGGAPVHLGPVTFLDEAGDWRDAEGHYQPEPPSAAPSARLVSRFAETWVIASAARALPGGPDSVRYFNSRLPEDCPAARVVARLAALRGATVLAADAPDPLAVLAVRTAFSLTVAIANPGPDTMRFHLPDGAAITLAGFAATWLDLPPDALLPLQTR